MGSWSRECEPGGGGGACQTARVVSRALPSRNRPAGRRAEGLGQQGDCMRTKLCVLGAVLGVVPGVLLESCGEQTHESKGPRREAVRRAAERQERKQAVPREQVPAHVEPGEPSHPCTLVTVEQVPCDSSRASCEYTWWECPRRARPLRA